MILILSQSKAEFSTELVMDWLSANRADFFLLTGDELLDTVPMHFMLDNEVKQLSIQGPEKKFDDKEITAVWFRRKVSGDYVKFYENMDCSWHAKHTVINYLIKEYGLFYSTLSLVLDKVPWLNTPETSAPNKLYALITAKECGLEIPSTLVTNFPDNNGGSFTGKHITKSLTDYITIKEKPGTYYDMLSSLVDAEKVRQEQMLVFPSLIQEYMEKRFEIRTFYLNGTCKSIAIFSQLDEQTKVDFRNYNYKNPNRYVPYRLPLAIEKKLRKFMKRMRLESGSIDLIRTKDNRFVFLEVNPVGQFDWVSFNGNYGIEKDIAIYLLTKSNHEERKKRRAKVP
jgi:ATP-GRASP peptide maturase of grasp-with-spasm system